MKPEIEFKIYRIYLEIEGSQEKIDKFLLELGARRMFGPRGCNARRGFHKIEIREYCGDSCLFIEVPISRAEKMIMLGWTP